MATEQSQHDLTACSVGPLPTPLPARLIPRHGSHRRCPSLMRPAAASSVLTSCSSDEDPHVTGSLPNSKQGKS